MKHRALWLSVFILGGMPLTAAALDYGPNQPLLAANGGESNLPGNAAAGPGPALPAPSPELADPDTGSGGGVDDDAGPRRATPPGPSAQRQGKSPSGKSHHSTTPARPDRPPAQSSWQSLLPGSIQ